MLGSGTSGRNGLGAIRLRSTTGVLECLNIESWQSPNSKPLNGIDIMTIEEMRKSDSVKTYKELEGLKERLKRLEEWIAALDPIAQHSGQSENREWHGVDTGWLYPSHVVYLGEAKP